MTLVIRVMRRQRVSVTPQQRTLAVDVTPPHKRRGRFRRGRAGVWRWLRRYNEALFMLVLGVVTFVAAILWVLPPRDVDTPLPDGLLISVPAFVNDTQGWWPLLNATVDEAHDDEVRKLAPKIAAGNVRLGFTAWYGKPGMSDYFKAVYSKTTFVTTTVYLPDNAEVLTFQDTNAKIDGMRAQDPPIPATWQVKEWPTAGGKQSHPTKRYLEVRSPLYTGEFRVSFFIDVRGGEGFTYRTNRTRVTTLFPDVRITGEAPPMPRTLPTLTYDINTTGLLRDARQVNWSVRPNLEQEDGVMFSERSTPIGQTPINQTPITGVRDEVLRADHAREIWAGILFGVAGAAVIGFCQSMFAAWRRKTGRED